MKKIIGLLVALLILFSVPINVYADDFNCGNDGNPRDSNTCYEDSGLVSSFKDCEYYDVSIPYNITYSELGGGLKNNLENVHEWYSYDEENSIHSGSGGIFTFLTYNSAKAWNLENYPYLTDLNVGDAITIENDYTSSVLSNRYNQLKGIAGGNLTINREPDGTNYIENTNGIKFYIAAVGSYAFATTAGKDWGSNIVGNVFDVICDDGTTIHFIVGDTIADNHACRTGDSSTENLKFVSCIHGGRGKDMPRHTCTASSCVQGETNPLINECYKGLCHFTGGQVIEIWSRGGSKDSVIANLIKDKHIAYIRVYNLTLKDLDSIEVSSGVTPYGAYWNMTISSNNVEASNLNQQNGAFGKDTFYSDEQLGVFNKLTEQNIQADLIDNANRDNLDSNELNNLINWENNIEQDSQEGGFIYWARRIVSIFGIILIIWIILIYIAYWFDKLNNIFDIDLLLILTFGRLRVSDTEDNCTFSMKNMAKTGTRTVNHRAILLICIVGITFGVLVVSGVLYKILSKLVYAVLNFLS